MYDAQTSSGQLSDANSGWTVELVPSRAAELVSGQSAELVLSWVTGLVPDLVADGSARRLCIMHDVCSLFRLMTMVISMMMTPTARIPPLVPM